MVSLNPRSRAFLSGYGLGLGGAVLALVFSVVGGVIVLGLGAVGAELSRPIQTSVLLVFAQILPFAGFPVAYFVVYRDFSWSELRSYLGVRVPGLRDLAVVAGGLVAVFVLVLASGAVISALDATTAENNASQAAQQSQALAALFVAASLLVIGPCEEMLFRGTVQNRLREAFSAPTAITLTAVLFAAIHYGALSGAAGARVATIAILLPPSFAFGVAYEYTENLVVPTLIHGLWNAFLFSTILLAGSVGSATLLPVSPLLV
ncbi:MAG: CAAX amino terminal protease family [halophilic archaeon J07HB67]|nr:MAG: CAAX amino terminal protease family [halophilic archaeon J07HB67]